LTQRDTGSAPNPAFRLMATRCQIVRHGPTGALSNCVPLVEMLQALLKWMVEDEAAANTYNSGRLRLPLVLSVENNNKSDMGESEMAFLFKDILGSRLVPPKDLKANATLRQVAAVERKVIIKSSSWKGSEMGAKEWADIVAVWKPASHPLDQHAIVCKSVEAPATVTNMTLKRLESVAFVARKQLSGRRMSTRTSNDDAEFAPHFKRDESFREEDTPNSPEDSFSMRERRSNNSVLSQESPPGVPAFTKRGSLERLGIGTQRQNPKADMVEDLVRRVTNAMIKAEAKREKANLSSGAVICKVYPPKVYQDSRNFSPIGGFESSSSLVSLNMQGRAKSGRAKLSGHVMRGGLAPVADHCCREKVRSMEAIFLKYGYDGYMRKHDWELVRNEFQKKLDNETKSGWRVLRVVSMVTSLRKRKQKGAAVNANLTEELMSKQSSERKSFAKRAPSCGTIRAVIEESSR